MSSHHPSEPQQSMLHQSNSTETGKVIRTNVIVPLPSGLKIVRIPAPNKACTMQATKETILQPQKMPSLTFTAESLKQLRSVNSSTMMLKTENGQYRLLRFGSKMQSILSPGQMVPINNPPGQRRIEPKAVALPPLSQIKETPITLPDISKGKVQRFPQPPDEEYNPNDVIIMGGIDLQEEERNNCRPSEHIEAKIRSCNDKFLLHLPALKKRIQAIAARHGLQPPDNDVASIVSHAAEAHLQTIVEKLGVIAKHRRDNVAQDPHYEVSKDVRGQINFLNSVGKAEERRREEAHRETLMCAARAKTKPDDPEQSRLKRKADEMQRAETEAMRKRNANQTALNAIGPRKKPKLDESGQQSMAGKKIKISPRVNHVTMRDMIFFLEHEKETNRSSILYNTYLK